MTANINNNVLTLRHRVGVKKYETGQRWGQAFFNYFLTKGQQDYVLKHHPELYHIDSKVQFTAWLEISTQSL